MGKIEDAMFGVFCLIYLLAVEAAQFYNGLPLSLIIRR
jgi:hypothetical protein